jgi:hypothetical protein
MHSIKTAICAGLLASVILSNAASAQQVEPVASTDEIEDIVVTARRIEGPMWEVRRGDSVLILVGSIDGLPKTMEWRTEALTAAVERADRVLFPVEGRGSLADVGRLIWRFRTLTRLSNGRTSADYLSPELEARVEQVTGEGPTRDSMLILSGNLMEIGGYGSGARPVSSIVRKATRANRTPAEPVGTLRGDELVERVLTTPPENYLGCIEAATAAAEAGPEAGAQRAEAWRLRRVPALLASPLEKAATACSYWSVMAQADDLRRIWNTAVEKALAEPGVTVAIAPLRLLAEPEGVLDRLDADGLEPLGPEWRPSAP